ncbi:MAG TPA: hypothetical protein VLC97_13400 [Rhodanobacteraceae bacterium]|nr:hypothetical protein [Rhodanobacteraceae bacterium]
MLRRLPLAVSHASLTRVVPLIFHQTLFFVLLSFVFFVFFVFFVVQSLSLLSG